MEFNKELFTHIPKNFKLGDSIIWTDTKDPNWIYTKEKPHEETLQTILSFYLKDVTDENITFLGLSGRYWGEADLIGIDEIGRIHLFELKRNRITTEVVNQLSHYLLNKIFRDQKSFINYWKNRTINSDLNIENLTIILAGYYLGERTDNLGRKISNKILSLDNSKTQWLKINKDEQKKIILNALTKKGESLNKIVPEYEKLKSLAKDLHDKIKNDLISHEQCFSSRYPAVIWLVGSSIKKVGVETEILKWRAAGVDARLLEAEVNILQNRDYVLRIKKENFPNRTLIVEKILNWYHKNDQQKKYTISKLKFYQEVSASQPPKKKKNGGLPLSKKEIEAVIKIGDEQISITL